MKLFSFRWGNTAKKEKVLQMENESEIVDCIKGQTDTIIKTTLSMRNMYEEIRFALYFIPYYPHL